MYHSEAIKVITIILATVHMVSGKGSFYFVTHGVYKASTLNSPPFLSTNITGSLRNAVQQCRRNCTLNPRCQAIELTQNTATASDVGKFFCRYFPVNACNWTSVSLKNITPGTVRTWWEKLDADRFKPQPCVLPCVIQNKDNCSLFRDWLGFTEFPWDTTPRLCSDYNFTGYQTTFVWPFESERPPIFVSCYGQYTRFLSNDITNSNTRLLGTLSHIGWVTRNLTDPMPFNFMIGQIDWSTLSYLVSISKYKQLFILETITSNLSTEHTFDGFELNPFGELTLTSHSSPTSSLTGFPIPLYKKPFMYPGTGSAHNCSYFWEFESNVSICDQRTSLFNFGFLKWDGRVPFWRGSVSIMFG